MELLHSADRASKPYNRIIGKIFGSMSTLDLADEYYIAGYQLQLEANCEKALEAYNKAIRYYTKVRDNEKIRKMYLLVAECYEHLQNYSNAIVYYCNYLNTYPDSILCRADVYEKIAKNYGCLKDNEANIRYTMIACNLYEQLGINLSVQRCLKKIVEVYTRMGEMQNIINVYQAKVESECRKNGKMYIRYCAVVTLYRMLIHDNTSVARHYLNHYACQSSTFASSKMNTFLNTIAECIDSGSADPSKFPEGIDSNDAERFKNTVRSAFLKDTYEGVGDVLIHDDMTEILEKIRVKIISTKQLG